MRQARLPDSGLAELATVARECTFLFTDADGWPAGVTMSHLYADDGFWLTALTGRAHVAAVERDPRVGMVISNAGTDLPGRRMVRIKGHATVHRDRETLDRVLPMLAARLAPTGQERLLTLLDSPRRVVVRVEIVGMPQSHDSRRVAGDGRGSPGPMPTRPVSAPP
ncbi:MAG: pyridoxamine 5'-phosphate oxidase family protein [Pseudonocardiaceae bacterium]|nr:MAG: pyridoxamine 5'-phosphate oxidase family protein [Pseudonocardiaceae bacterium]